MAEAWALGDADRDVLLGYHPDRCEADELVIGPGYRLRSGTVIYAGSTIGARLTTGHHVVIREQNTIGSDVAIWANTVIDYGCSIGSRVKIHSNCYVAQYTQIDNDAFLAPGVTIANDLYPQSPGSRERMAGPHIGSGARIGVNTTVLPFVRIGAGALIGSGSVVTRDVPPGTVAYGNPARLAGLVSDLRPIDARVVVSNVGASRYRWVDGDRHD